MLKPEHEQLSILGHRFAEITATWAVDQSQTQNNEGLTFKFQHPEKILEVRTPECWELFPGMPLYQKNSKSTRHRCWYLGKFPIHTELGDLGRNEVIEKELEGKDKKASFQGFRPVSWAVTRRHTVLSHVWLFVTPWTVARQALLSMEFSRQEYWSGLPFPSPEDLLNPGIKAASLKSPALASRCFTTSTTWEALSDL